jgi:mono/diheme cytochrome c family protein
VGSTREFAFALRESLPTANVAASDRHADWVAWAFDTTMHNSVRRRAEDIPVPAGVTEEQLRNGFRSYDAMCVQCHGAPGVKATEWAMGMRPNPPPLSEVVAHWNPAEVFWILRNGIKMTGMPALGPTHEDEELWSIVAFVERLPNVTAEEYAALRQQLGRDSGGGHHAGGTGGGEGVQSRRSQPSGDAEAVPPDHERGGGQGGSPTEGHHGGEGDGRAGGSSGDGHHGEQDGGNDAGSEADHRSLSQGDRAGTAGQPAEESR